VTGQRRWQLRILEDSRALFLPRTVEDRVSTAPHLCTVASNTIEHGPTAHLSWPGSSDRSHRKHGRETTVRKAGAPGPALLPATDWRTTDAHELAKWKLRAREERHRITNVDRAHPVFSNFEVQSPSGMTYRAEIRDVASRQFSCTCTDFRINGLGTCKHIEAILLQLARRHRSFSAVPRSMCPA
jgi:hypothetical protein